VESSTVHPDKTSVLVAVKIKEDKENILQQLWHNRLEVIQDALTIQHVVTGAQ
jgi:hypothetical protein